MAQAITTKYIGPSNTRGSRVIVNSWLGRTTEAYDCGLRSELAHLSAIESHLEKMTKRAAAAGREVSYQIVGQAESSFPTDYMGCNAADNGYTVLIK